MVKVFEDKVATADETSDCCIFSGHFYKYKCIIIYSAVYYNYESYKNDDTYIVVYHRKPVGH